MLAVAAVVVLGAGVGLGVWTFAERPAPVVTAPRAVATPTPGPTAASVTPPQPGEAKPGDAKPGEKPDIPAPTFDVVLVSPDGGAVIAGRAAAGALVTVHENGSVVGTARADSHGSWVVAPDTKLLPGAGELTLMAESASGTTAGDAPVLVVVPDPASNAAPRPAATSDATPAPSVAPLAVLVPPSGPSRVLQAPGPATPGGKLAVGTVDYDQNGAIQFSGSAPPDQPVRVYVDNAVVGDGAAGGDGHWTVSPTIQMRPGVHTLRLDEIDTDGHVVARVELPFLRETLAQAQLAPGKVVVQPGENLWRLARNVYGLGIRYTVIYRANRTQIRDPKHIYPGQVFRTPGATHQGPPAAPPATQAAASR